MTVYTPYPNYEEEVAGSATTVRAYYLLGGQALALRVTSSPAELEDGLYFLHTDHLGSTTLLTDENGGAGSVTRYYPYGEYRTGPGTDLTDRGFTGHKGNNLPGNDLGLIYMNARYYDPYVYRMLTPDTIVPDPMNPQQFNRYAYTLNNPVKFRDPSGRCARAVRL